MACIIKLQNDCYLEWNKASDSPASYIMNEIEVKKLITEQIYVQQLLNPTKIMDISLAARNLFNFLETFGTTDLGKSVTVEFCLKYYRDPLTGRSVTLPELIKKYTKP